VIDKLRTGWMQFFTQMRRPKSALTSMFEMRPGNNYAGAKVALDIERYDEDVAVVVTTCTGPNFNDISEDTTKEFTPPSYAEAVPINVCDLLSRMVGVNPFDAANTSYAAQLLQIMQRAVGLMFDKIVRGVELQASQILTTGQLTLKGADGATRYTLDFKPKATHFPTVSVAWSDTANADPLGDLESLALEIRKNGKVDANMAILGRLALKNALANDAFQAAMDNLRIDVGAIRPEFRDSGMTFYGFVWVGNYRIELWTYDEMYKDPETGNLVPHIGDNQVVVKSSSTRLDFTSAEVPLPIGPDPRVAALMPGRVVDRSGSLDVTPNVYCSPNGKTVFAELESRLLLIPTQIDGFGCITTEV
jgi:hypothetical protein